MCSEVKATAAHVLGWRQGEAMGVGLRPIGKPVDKPPNPKAARAPVLSRPLLVYIAKIMQN